MRAEKREKGEEEQEEDTSLEGGRKIAIESEIDGFYFKI